MATSMWGIRRRKRPVAPGFADRKRAAFFTAAVRRYAWNDYERVGIRELARYAGVSVATFYDRFGSLRAFRYAVATAHFQAAARSLDREFDPKAWPDAPPQTIGRRIAWHVVSSVAGDTIGITRMTVRLAMTAPRAAQAYEGYRSTLTEHAVRLLAPKLKVADPKKTVRQAMCALLAVATDTAWRHYGPLLKGERQSLAEELAGHMSRSLGFRDTAAEGSSASPGADETLPMMIFRGVRQSDLPIYRKNLRLFEQAVNEPYRPKAKPSGGFLDPEDALAVSLPDEEPPPRRPRRPSHKPKKRFRLI
jgi:AcrR family transcriptional regulator